jgi:hypothetical protein
MGKRFAMRGIADDDVLRKLNKGYGDWDRSVDSRTTEFGWLAKQLFLGDTLTRV